MAFGPEAMMRYETLFLAMTAGLINCEASRFDHALQTIEEAFEGLELRRVRVPGHSSIGAREIEGHDLSLLDWIHELRRMNVRAGSPGLVVPRTRHGRGARKVERLADRNTRSLLIQSKAGGRLYAMKIENSSPHLMPARHFAAWISRQPHSGAIWSRILTEINEFNQTRQFEMISQEQIESYFDSVVGVHVFNVIGDRCLEAAQSAAFIEGHDLQINEDDGEEASYFDRGDSEAVIHAMLGGKEEEFVPFEEMLQLRGPVTGEELAALFDAQTVPPEVWAQVNESLLGIGAVTSVLEREDLKQVVRQLPPEFIETYGHSLVARMQNACRGQRAVVRIPESLRERLMTHLQTLSPRERAAFVPTAQRLHFVPNREPWQHYCFISIGTFDVDASGDLATSARGVQKILRQAYAFASRMELDYAQTFGLANFLLSPEAGVIFASDDGFEKVRPLLARQGYDENAQNMLEEEIRSLYVLKELGYGDRQLEGMCAEAVADVFRAGGSWNEIEFADRADQKEYEEISEALFEALQDLHKQALKVPG